MSGYSSNTSADEGDSGNEADGEFRMGGRRASKKPKNSLYRQAELFMKS